MFRPATQPLVPLTYMRLTASWAAASWQSLYKLCRYTQPKSGVCYFLLQRDLMSMNLVPAWTGRSGAKSSDRQWMKMGLKMTNMKMIY